MAKTTNKLLENRIEYISKQLNTPLAWMKANGHHSLIIPSERGTYSHFYTMCQFTRKEFEAYIHGRTHSIPS